MVVTQPPDETSLDRLVLAIGRDVQQAAESLHVALDDLADTHRRMDRLEIVIYGGCALLAVVGAVIVIAFTVKGFMR